MAESPIEITDQLRRWARGMYTTEAATELLIRARNGAFATIERPWIKCTDHAHWIDFPAVTEHLGGLSGGEQRLLRIAASIGSDEASAVRLGDVVTGLDRPALRFVLAAIAHAGGSHQHSCLVIDRHGRATITKQPSLFIWDREARSTSWSGVAVAGSPGDQCQLESTARSVSDRHLSDRCLGPNGQRQP